MKTLLISFLLFIPMLSISQSPKIVVLDEVKYAECEEILRNQQPIFEGCRDDGKPINLEKIKKSLVLSCEDSGKVYVRALIGKEGTVIAYKVVKSTNERLEEKFLIRFPELKFKRECPDVMPACLWLTIPIVFRCQN